MTAGAAATAQANTTHSIWRGTKMATFHSLSYAQIQGLAQRVPTGIVAGDLYFDNVGLQLFLAATDGALVPATNIIMSGNITGTPGPAGAASTVPGPQGPHGPAGEGATSNLTIQSANYSTLATDNTVLCTGAVPQTITLLATGISAGQKFTVTVLSTAVATVSVVSQHGETIEGDTGGAALYAGDSADFVWTGANWILQ
jgi:hypothetical protein